MFSHLCFCLFVFISFLTNVYSDYSPSTSKPNQFSIPVQPKLSFLIPPGQVIPQQRQILDQQLDQEQPQQYCNITDLEICLYNLTKGPFANGNAIFNVINETTFALACSQLPTFKKCIEEKGKQCTEFDLFLFTGNLDSLNYVCNINKPGYFKMQACLNDIEKFYAYNTNYYGCFTYLTSSFTPDSHIIGQVCKQTNGIYSCYVNASQLCDSTDFMINYYKSFMSPAINLYYKCKLDYTNWNTTQVYSECNTEKLTKCLVNDSISTINPIDGLNIITSGINITLFCKSVTAKKICIFNESKCDREAFFLTFSTVLANFYLCSEGLTGYNELVKCYENNKSIFNSCVFKAINCKEINDFHKCLVDSTKESCGDGTFIQNYFYEILFSWAKVFKCNLNLQIISPNNATNGCMPPKCDNLCGYGNKNDTNGCQICTCVNPCETVNCPANNKCRVEDVYCHGVCPPTIKCYPIIST